MVKVEFEYKDKDHKDWTPQTGVTSSVQRVIEWYGLEEPGVFYRIVRVTDLESGEIIQGK